MILKKNKYKAKRTAGYDSKAEHDYGEYILRPMEKAGEISNLKKQDSVELIPGINWKVDFSYEVDGVKVYEEYKGFETVDYKLKLKLWKLFGPATLKIIKGVYPRFVVKQVIPAGRYKVIKA